jgi:hypothetical protein
MGVEVTTEPSWVYEMEKELGKADPNAPPEKRFTTAIRFKAESPDLQEMESKWKMISNLLPNKKHA